MVTGVQTCALPISAPASVNLAFNSSASSLATFSLTVFGAPSTRSLASFNPNPVASLTTLITWILLAPASFNTTSNVDFSSAAPATAPAAAGAAAHLGGVIAAYTTVPVIGIPINATPLNGMDALLSFVQMPAGIPVATMAINGAKNAALFAVQILATKYPELVDKLADDRKKMQEEVKAKGEKLAAMRQAQ